MNGFHRMVLPALVVLLLPGCASGPAPAEGGVSRVTSADAAQPIEFRRGVDGTNAIIQKGQPLGGMVDGTVQSAWAALQAAYDDIGLTVTTKDPTNGLIASDGQRLVRLAGRRASYWVDCGRDLSGVIADESQVLVSVTSAVQTAGDGGTIVGTRVDAEARARGNVDGVRDCTSTTKLESLVLQKVREGMKR